MEDINYRALCDIDDVTATLGITLTQDDSRRDLIARLINSASDEIYNFTDREFHSVTKDYWDSASDTEVRQFDVGWYGLGKNVLEIGDLMEQPTEVVITDKYGEVTATLITTDYDLFPKIRQRGFPYQFIRLLRHRLSHDSIVEITGKWGWPIIPEAVRNSCIETVSLWYDQINLHSQTVETDLIQGQPRRNLPPSVRESLSAYRRYRG